MPGVNARQRRSFNITCFGKAVKDNPSLLLSTEWEAVKGLPGALVDGFREAGHAIGEGAAVTFSQDLTDKLNLIYGDDVSGKQQALLAIRITVAVTGAGTTAKTATGMSEAVAKALEKKLDILLESKNLAAKGTGGAAGKVDGVVSPSSKPEWLQRLDAGNEFNKVQAKNYPHNEVYIQRPDGNGYYRVDSYNPVKGEIVSRKLTQLSEVSEATAKSYINEVITKYPSGATIAQVPSSGSLGGQKLQSTIILEIPPQKSVIPQAILDSANKAGVLIGDTNGKVY
jgi:hypothetical protein